MKTVVITGSTRGLGLEMATLFRKEGWNLVVNGVNEARLEQAVQSLRALDGAGEVEGCRGSVASTEELQALVDFAAQRFGAIDIWINNAGVNQPMKAIWELSAQEIDAILDIDLRGAVMGSRLAAHVLELLDLADQRDHDLGHHRPLGVTGLDGQSGLDDGAGLHLGDLGIGEDA